MSDDPNRNQMPWETPTTRSPTPPDPATTPPDPVSGEPPATPDQPTAPPPPPAPGATPGLISAAPVGWTGQDIGQGGASSTAPPVPPVTPAAGGPGSSPAAPWSPAVAWEQPTAGGHAVPGAPGLVFAGTLPRFVGWIVDWFLIAITGSIVASILGYGTTTFARTTTGFTTANSMVAGAPFYISYAVVSLVYFVFFWTGGRRATIGQRIFNLQVGNAFDGRGLTLDQALRRWFGLGSVIGVLALIPGLTNGVSLIEFVWWIVLVVSTSSSPTKQGIHDRFAGSAVVRPAGQTSGLAAACLVLVVGLLLLIVISIVALIFLGSQMSDILDEIGRSI